MSCDRRHTAGLVADVLAVLHQHGYRPGDLVHAHRAVHLIGDLARIYQGTQDAPAGAYIIQFLPRPQPDAGREAGAWDGGQPDLADPAAPDARSSSGTGEAHGSDDGGAR